MELCEVHKAYGEVFCVDTKLVAEVRKNSNRGKTDEDDARVILQIAEDYLTRGHVGRLPSGVWPFRPDALKRAIGEAERAFRCYQKVRAIWPEKAQQLKEEYKAKVKEVEKLAAEDRDCQELVETLSGFGRTGTSVPTAISELHGRRFHSVKALYLYGQKTATTTRHQ